MTNYIIARAFANEIINRNARYTATNITATDADVDAKVDQLNDKNDGYYYAAFDIDSFNDLKESGAID